MMKGAAARAAAAAAIVFAAAAATALAATPDYPPAGDFPFGSLSVKLVQKVCHIEPGCTSAQCGAIPSGVAAATMLGSHLRGTGGPFATMSVATGFGLVIDASDGEHPYTIGGIATLLYTSPSAGTIAFSAVTGTPSIGSSFPFTVKSASADGGFTFTYVVQLPDCPLTIQGSY